MSIMSVSIPNDLKDKMNHIDEINWSAIARKAFEEKIREIEFLKEISKKSKLTKKDADELINKINKSATDKFMRT